MTDLFDLAMAARLAGPGGGSGGTSNYEELENKPSINGVPLVGDSSADDLGLTAIRTLTYTGTGSNTNTIEFPVKPLFILSIDGYSTNSDYINTVGFRYGVPFYTGSYKTNSSGGVIWGNIVYSADELSMTLTSSDPGAACNYNGKTYTVVYIPDTNTEV